MYYLLLTPDEVQTIRAALREVEHFDGEVMTSPEGDPFTVHTPQCSAALELLTRLEVDPKRAQSA